YCGGIAAQIGIGRAEPFTEVVYMPQQMPLRVLRARVAEIGADAPIRHRARQHRGKGELAGSGRDWGRARLRSRPISGRYTPTAQPTAYGATSPLLRVRAKVHSPTLCRPPTIAHCKR